MFLVSISNPPTSLKFRNQSLDGDMLQQRLGVCFNCLRSGHHLAQCNSTHHCRLCHGSHHTLLHREVSSNTSLSSNREDKSTKPSQQTSVVANTAVQLKSSTYNLPNHCIFCRWNAMTARSLLDSGSATSLISECLAMSLNFPRSHQTIQSSGIAGTSPSSPMHSAVNLSVSSVR